MIMNTQEKEKERKGAREWEREKERKGARERETERENNLE